MFIPTDTRIWEVFDDKGNSLGAHLYGDMVIQFNDSKTFINGAYYTLDQMGYTCKVIGDIHPLGEISENILVEEVRIKRRKKEAKRENKIRSKKGYRLDSTIRFGKHSGKTIREIISNFHSYWDWLCKENVLMLHPELDEFKTK